MRNVIEAALATVAAFLVFSLLGRISTSLVLVLNVFSVLVVYYAVLRGEIFGAVLGSACGLIQDSFSLGVFGVGGLSKTVLGFLAGYISRKIHVVPFFRNLVFIFILGILELAIWLALYSFIFSERPLVRNGLIFVQPAVTALLGSLSLCLQRRIQSRKN